MSRKIHKSFLEIFRKIENGENQENFDQKALENL